MSLMKFKNVILGNALTGVGRFFGSHMRLVWALFGLGAYLCGMSALANLCVGLNVADGGARNCGSAASNSDALKMISGLVVLGMSIVVWFFGRTLQIKELSEENAAKAAELKTQEEIYQSGLVTPQDRKQPKRKVIAQMPFTLPIFDPNRSPPSLEGLVGELQEYARVSLSRANRAKEVTLQDGSQQTIFTLGATRLSSFLAIVSKTGAILMIDRSRSKVPTTDNERFDFFGSVGYENLSLHKKLLNAPMSDKLKVLEYKSIPGFVAEEVYFEDSGKYETAVMIGHLAVVTHEGMQAMRESTNTNNGDLIILDRPSYPDHSAMTAKAVLAINYINRNPDGFIENAASKS